MILDPAIFDNEREFEEKFRHMVASNMLFFGSKEK
jgi:hypothetical protein